MKLNKCKMGEIVINNYEEIGHIVGLSLNPLCEVTVLVKYASGSLKNTHPDNIQKLTGE